MPNHIRLEIIGHTGGAPELRTTPAGKSVASVSVAYTNKKTNKTLWVKCKFWDKLAEVASQYVKKGDAIMCAGEPEIETWKDKSTGADRFTVALNVRDFTMIGRTTRGDSNDGSPAGESPDDSSTPSQGIPF